MRWQSDCRHRGESRRPLKLILGLLLAATQSHAQPFRLEHRLLPPADGIEAGVYRSASAWGDIVGRDGDLDLLLAGNHGETTGILFLARQYRGFMLERPLLNLEPRIPMQGIDFASLDLGDADGDGDLDFVLTGRRTGTRAITLVYTSAEDIESDREEIHYGVKESARQIANVQGGDARFGDFDNDGDLDIAITGAARSEFVTGLFRNDGPGLIPNEIRFTEIGAGLAGVADGALCWGDFDNDGDLDLVVSGRGTSFLTILYRNDGPRAGDTWNFSEVDAGLPQVAYGSISAGDLDGDGFLDIVLTGCMESDCARSIAESYRNSGNLTFASMNAGLPGVYRSAVDLGDFDNDGDLDILIAGEDSANPGSSITRIYRNDGGAFMDIGAALPGVTDGSAVWGDYDLDGRLDLALTGYSFEERRFVVDIYRNETPLANSRPWPPTGLETVSVDESSAVLRWSAALETPKNALTYNLWVSQASSGRIIVPPHAHADGVRMLPRPGNVGHVTQWSLTGLIPGESYSWRVQAIDHGYAGSAFSEEARFVVPGSNDNFVARIDIERGSQALALYFGTHTRATAGFDSALDVLAPPPPDGPFAMFDARIVNGPLDYLRDVRAPISDMIEWELSVQHLQELTWYPQQFPEKGRFILRHATVEVDMRERNTYRISFQVPTVHITYRVDDSITTTSADSEVVDVEPRLHGHYPNPARMLAVLVFDLPFDAAVEVEVYDVLGRLVRRESRLAAGAGRGIEMPLDLQGLPPGLYVYHVSIQSGRGLKKLSSHLVLAR